MPGVIKTYKPSQMAAAIRNLVGGTKNILYGVDAPVSSLGQNGDVYFRCYPFSVLNEYGQYINTGYIATNDSKYIIDFIVTGTQQSLCGNIFGGRPNASAVSNSVSLCLAQSEQNYNHMSIQWGSTGTIVASNWPSYKEVMNSIIHVELSAGLARMSIDDIWEPDLTWSPTTYSDNGNEVVIYGMKAGTNVPGWSFSSDIALISFKIYENDVLLHHFVPAKDQNDIVCIYDEISEEYKYVNTGSLTYRDDKIIGCEYLKVNGIWQLLEGSNIDDVNTEDLPGLPSAAGEEF